MSSRSPPPLHHPKPTHPAYPPPEPPRSTASSPYSQTGRLSQDLDGYTRYSSPPVGYDPGQAQAQQQVPLMQQQQQQQQQHASTSAYTPAQGQMHARGAAAGANAAYGQNAYGASPAAPGQPGNFPAWPGVNDATAQMGVQFGRSAISAGQSYVQQNVSDRPVYEMETLTPSSCGTSRCRWSRRASRSQTAMCSANSASSSSPGGTAHGAARCCARRTRAASTAGSPHETTSMPPICTFLVSSSGTEWL